MSQIYALYLSKKLLLSDEETSALIDTRFDPAIIRQNAHIAARAVREMWCVHLHFDPELRARYEAAKEDSRYNPLAMLVVIWTCGETDCHGSGDSREL